MGTHENCLVKAILINTHSRGFYGEITSNKQNYSIIIIKHAALDNQTEKILKIFALSKLLTSSKHFVADIVFQNLFSL